MTVYLAKNFTLDELCRTTHRRWLPHNRPPDKLIPSGQLLAAELQKVRDYFGPVIVHSGYRCQGLNSAIGGSKTSQHMQFEAADFHVHGRDFVEVFEWIWKKSDIDFSQLILEGWSAGKPSWIHLGICGPAWQATGKASRQVLSFDGARYTRLQ